MSGASGVPRRVRLARDARRHRNRRPDGLVQSRGLLRRVSLPRTIDSPNVESVAGILRRSHHSPCAAPLLALKTRSLMRQYFYGYYWFGYRGSARAG